MIAEAFTYPWREEDWLRTVGVGGLLTLGAPLVLPALLLQGYLLRVLRSAVRGERTAPPFENWRGLLTDGARLLVVQVGYALVPAAVAAVGVGVAAAGAFWLDRQVLEVGGLAVAGSGGVLLGVAVFVLPAGMAHFARERNLRAAFDVTTVARAAFSPEYVSAFALAVVVGAVGSVAAAAATTVLLGPFVLFYVQVAVYYMFARGYVRGRDLEGASVPGAVGPPT